MSEDAPQSTEVLQQPLNPEEQLETKVVVFEDERGIERRPHPEAAECYASEEVQAEVSQHMMEVDRGIDEISTRLEDLTGPEAERLAGFHVLSDELLGRIKAKAKEQLPTLTVKQTVQQERQVITGRIFKKTTTEQVPVEIEVEKAGRVVATEDQELQKGWSKVRTQAEQKGERSEAMGLDVYEQIATDMLDELLTGDAQTMPGASDRLPLLAKKLKEANLSEEQIDALKWEDIEALVPEAGAWFADIHTLDDSLNDRAISKELIQLENELIKSSAINCKTIAKIYYDDETLRKISDLYDVIGSRRQEISARLHPEKSSAFVPRNLYEKQLESIRTFFDGALYADTILIHGTPFAPRVIQSGTLKPAAKMTAEEFTFNSGRTNIANATDRPGIQGSRAVHFAGINSTPYAIDEKITEEILRRRLEHTLSLNGDLHHPWIEQELAKGGIGVGRMGIRLGDVIHHAAFGGNKEVSLGSQPNAQPQQRKGIVELTPAGFEKVQARLGTSAGADVAYIAAPQTRSNEELYDYEFPIEELMIGIPSRDPDTIPNALRARGWTEEQIAEHTYVYDGHAGEGEELQEKILRQGKYARSVVVPVALES